MKTTLSVHAADWFRIHGWNVVYVDCDPQKLGYRYMSLAGATFATRHLTNDSQVLEEFPKLTREYDVVIADCPGGLSEITGAVIYQADIVLIPTPPGHMDLLGTEWTVETIKAIQAERSGLPQTGIIATRFKQGQRVSRNIRRKAKSIHFGFVETGVPEMAIITRACGIKDEDGIGWESPPKLIWEMGKSKDVRDAAKVFDRLFRENFSEACEEDPLKIAKMVTPHSRWSEIEEGWIGEEYDTRLAANA